jgi:hypothetical protein
VCLALLGRARSARGKQRQFVTLIVQAALIIVPGPLVVGILARSVRVPGVAPRPHKVVGHEVRSGRRARHLGIHGVHSGGALGARELHSGGAFGAREGRRRRLSVVVHWCVVVAGSIVAAIVPIRVICVPVGIVVPIGRVSVVGRLAAPAVVDDHLPRTQRTLSNTTRGRQRGLTAAAGPTSPEPVPHARGGARARCAPVAQQEWSCS